MLLTWAAGRAVRMLRRTEQQRACLAEWAEGLAVWAAREAMGRATRRLLAAAAVGTRRHITRRSTFEKEQGAPTIGATGLIAAATGCEAVSASNGDSTARTLFTAQFNTQLTAPTNTNRRCTQIERLNDWLPP